MMDAVPKSIRTLPRITEAQRTPPPAGQIEAFKIRSHKHIGCWEIIDESNVKRAVIYKLEDAQKFAAMPELVDICRRLIKAHEVNLLGEANWNTLFDVARAAFATTQGEKG